MAHRIVAIELDREGPEPLYRVYANNKRRRYVAFTIPADKVDAATRAQMLADFESSGVVPNTS